MKVKKKVTMGRGGDVGAWENVVGPRLDWEQRQRASLSTRRRANAATSSGVPLREIAIEGADKDELIVLN